MSPALTHQGKNGTFRTFRNDAAELLIRAPLCLSGRWQTGFTRDLGKVTLTGISGMCPLTLSAASVATLVPYPLDRSLSNRNRPRLAPMSCRNIPASIDARKIAAPGAKRPIATIAAKGKNPESPQPSPNRTPPSNALPVGTSTSVSPCPPRSGRDSRWVKISTSMATPSAASRPRPRVRSRAPSGVKKPSRSVG